VLLERIVTSPSIAKPGTLRQQKPNSTKLELPKSTLPKNDHGMSHTMAIIELASMQDESPPTE
jgi:hypothetical protein